MRPDVKLSAVVTAVQNRCKSKAPHLETHLTKNCGFATGLEFRESAFQLSAKSEQVFRAGMVFNLALGLENLEDKDATDSRGKKYALFLADTLLIKEEGGAEVLTERAPKAWGDISYYLKDDDDDDEGPSKSSSSKGKQRRDPREPHARRGQAARGQPGGGRRSAVAPERARGEHASRCARAAAEQGRQEGGGWP
jgi:nucleosome binding factor SPN SPT16 subunit